MGEFYVTSLILERLAGAYNKDFTDDQMREWHLAVKHLDEDTANRTCDLLIESSKWMPQISEFIQTSRSIRRHDVHDASQFSGSMSEQVQELQARGISVLRAIANARAGRLSMPSGGHDHFEGIDSCEVCFNAQQDRKATDCQVCELLEEAGLERFHCVS